MLTCDQFFNITNEVFFYTHPLNKLKGNPELVLPSEIPTAGSVGCVGNDFVNIHVYYFFFSSLELHGSSHPLVCM